MQDTLFGTIQEGRRYVGATSLRKRLVQRLLLWRMRSRAIPSKSNIIKSTIWSPNGPSQANDANYQLERSVTTPGQASSLEAVYWRRQ